MNEPTDGCTDARMHGRTDGRMDGRTKGRKNERKERTNKRTDGFGRMNRLMDERTNVRTDEEMNEYNCFIIHSIVYRLARAKSEAPILINL